MHCLPEYRWPWRESIRNGWFHPQGFASQFATMAASRNGSFDATAPGTLPVLTKSGVYPVHCTAYPTMLGALTVK